MNGTREEAGWRSAEVGVSVWLPCVNTFFFLCLPSSCLIARRPVHCRCPSVPLSIRSLHLPASACARLRDVCLPAHPSTCPSLVHARALSLRSCPMSPLSPRTVHAAFIVVLCASLLLLRRRLPSSCQLFFAPMPCMPACSYRIPM